MKYGTCKECAFFPEDLRDYTLPPINMQRDAYCLKEERNYVTDEPIRKQCKEKNNNGQCDDYIGVK